MYHNRVYYRNLKHKTVKIYKRKQVCKNASFETHKNVLIFHKFKNILFFFKYIIQNNVSNFCTAINQVAD